ncbi:hypothetical protein SAMD00019534_058110, partial [Acytostelium subglobosum LB1]|uniref:hypothetical protein n=1 Tax=Acytostelium subglobosum LB1 TaxID=1410327 RepID=UPI00064485C9
NNSNNKEICYKLDICSHDPNDVTVNKMAKSNEMAQGALDKVKARLQKKPVVLNNPTTPRSKTGFSGTSYILQLADIHMDPLYAVGSEPHCGEPQCCRNGTGAAGFWGDHMCDIPIWTVKQILSQIVEINKTMPISMVIWSGDNSPHDVWMMDEQTQVTAIQVMSEMIHEYFPNTIVMPSCGNHESYPMDEFLLPQQQWLLDTLADSWQPFLTSEEVATVKKAGYFTSVLQPGLRVISLFTFDADILNFYNLLRHSNLNIRDNQTDWFINTLEQAESHNEKVWVVGHIPCTFYPLPTNHWCRIYEAIFERFSEVIVGQFYGHTHFDQLVVFTETATHSMPTGTNYVAPSMTTYVGHDPAIRLYEFNYDTKQITNWYQYRTNITEANITGNLTMSLAYTPLELYQMPDLSNESWFNLTQRFLHNDTLLDDYYFQLRSGPHTTWMEQCDSVCRRLWYCEILGVTTDLLKECAD